MITFQQARDLVAGDPEVRDLYPVDDFEVGQYGWGDNARFLIVAGTHKDVTGEGDFRNLTMDPPTIFINKQTGSVDIQVGLRPFTDPTAGMVPIGSRTPGE